MDAAMAATIALKEQTKNRMNFETGYLFCHVETKSSNVCSGIFCFSDLFGMTSIAPPHRRGGFHIRPRILAITANVLGRWRALTPAAL